MGKSKSPKPSETPWRPTRAQLDAARAGTVRDVIDHELRVLFVGINPGLYSAAIGHHFGRPGNRFWPAVHAGGFTPRILSPFEEIQLLEYRLGITNIIARPTATADELTRDELQQGAKRLERKVRRYRPRFVALLGLTSYRLAFGRPKAVLGRQPDPLGAATIWLLPNPSGLNAHHQPKDLARLFKELRAAVEAE
jgi:TDG/mug DNA glycosylase family protein